MRSRMRTENQVGEGRDVREKRTRAHWVAAFRVESLKQNRNMEIDIIPSPLGQKGHVWQSTVA